MKKNKRLIPQPRRIEIDYSEKWGKDVEEAVRLALTDLKLSRDEVEVTVLEEPVRGFLGIGAKLAKVRVEKIKKPEEKEKPKEKHETKDIKIVSPASDKIDKKIEKPEKESQEQEQQQQQLNTKQKNQIRDLRKKQKTEENKTQAASSGNEKRRDSKPTKNIEGRDVQSSNRRDKSNDSKRGKRVENSQKNNVIQKKTPIKPTDANQNSYSKSLEKAKVSLLEKSNNKEKLSISEKPSNLVPISPGNEADMFFRDLTKKMHLDIHINSYENDECVYLEIEGKDSRTIIGKRGQTLDAIQYITNLVMNKNRNDYIRVIVDVEGYRSRREQTLENLAIKLSGKVEKTGRSVKLEPMNPYERKVIHSTLQSNPRINTRSEGEEPYRRVIIEKK